MSARIVDSCESKSSTVNNPAATTAPAAPKRTLTDVLPELLEELQTPENVALRARDEKAFRAHFDTDPRWAPMRKSAPRLWLKAMDGRLSLDDPYLQEMLAQIEQVRSGQRTMRDAWKSIDKRMTETYVYPQIGRPDAQGRPKGPQQE